MPNLGRLLVRCIILYGGSKSNCRCRPQYTVSDSLQTSRQKIFALYSLSLELIIFNSIFSTAIAIWSSCFYSWWNTNAIEDKLKFREESCTVLEQTPTQAQVHLLLFSYIFAVEAISFAHQYKTLRFLSYPAACCLPPKRCFSRGDFWRNHVSRYASSPSCGPRRSHKASSTARHRGVFVFSRACHPPRRPILVALLCSYSGASN